jgi:hypothetical protein
MLLGSSAESRARRHGGNQIDQPALASLGPTGRKPRVHRFQGHVVRLQVTPKCQATLTQLVTLPNDANKLLVK